MSTKVYITNLGKYNEGYSVLDCGKWLQLPVDEDELTEALESIDVRPDSEYEEFFITDSETDLPIQIDEFENIIELSEQVEEYENMSTDKQKVVLAILECGDTSDLEEAITLSDSYYLIPNISDEDSAGQQLLSERNDIPEDIQIYINYARYYEDQRINQVCELTSYGLLFKCC